MSVTSATEFSLINQFFTDLTPPRDDVFLGTGDDCALLNPSPNQMIAVSIDTLIEGVHFFADVNPIHLGHKALAVNLSDLAAMGATPAWFTLALSLPKFDQAWLAEFSNGLGLLAKQHNIQLVGGDTTRGPLTISIQVHGHVAAEKSLLRSAAKVGDWICVTGTLGDAAAALQLKLGTLQADTLTEADMAFLIDRLEKPTPRNTIGLALAGEAHAAIDISDGLLADLQHILAASDVGGCLDLTKLPFSSAMQKLPVHTAQNLALTGGDDYELCFTAAAETALMLSEQFPGMIQPIGEIIEQTGLFYQNTTGEKTAFESIKAGYDHFA